MSNIKPQDPESLGRPPSKTGSANEATNDAVFGEITEDGPNYRSLGWIATAALMSKTMIGLGVLSIPKAFDTLGLIPGTLCLLAISAITSWSNYMVGSFKLNHRDVYAIDDVGYKLFGRFGREFLGSAYWIYWVFVVGSGLLSISIAFNAISTHGTCTAVFVAVAAIVTFLMASIRTLGRISFIAWVGLASILGAILTLTVAVGVQNRPAAAPQEGPWETNYHLFKNPSFLEAVSAVSSLIFAFAGTTAFFPIVAEMREPRHYTRSLVICQSVVTSTHLSIGIVVYYFCGSYVASPALGSAGVLMKKVCYGIGLPGIFVSTIILTHISTNTLRHWATWLGCTSFATIIAYIVASAIPVFNNLVSLIGALLGTLMSFQPMGSWSIFVIASGTFLMVAIMNDYKANGGSSAWSCADNSNSV
ncbi:hypothetical protein FSARC_2859 [Fusarium sarcochroum]|uniref:Amino acid transporter transmembrane domain-containing protein n=1 Tax=Fusarium sarcochroum TaxID=1208366 RepID=A0A8H4U5C5_9HYPO|nr:hypothetical protein FSARC_2859 [Fusarium sarcochroum]